MVRSKTKKSIVDINAYRTRIRRIRVDAYSRGVSNRTMREWIRKEKEQAAIKSALRIFGVFDPTKRRMLMRNTLRFLRPAPRNVSERDQLRILESAYERIQSVLHGKSRQYVDRAIAAHDTLIEVIEPLL